MISELRREIDKIDAEIVKLLAKRMELSQQIGKEKQQTGEEIHVRTREIEVLDLVKLLGDQLGLQESFLTDLYTVILKESRQIQESA